MFTNKILTKLFYRGNVATMQQVDRQLEALEKHKKLIREHREKEEKLRERILNYHNDSFLIF